MKGVPSCDSPAEVPSPPRKTEFTQCRLGLSVQQRSHQDEAVFDKICSEVLSFRQPIMLIQNPQQSRTHGPCRPTILSRAAKPQTASGAQQDLLRVEGVCCSFDGHRTAKTLFQNEFIRNQIARPATRGGIGKAKIIFDAHGLPVRPPSKRPETAAGVRRKPKKLSSATSQSGAARRRVGSNVGLFEYLTHRSPPQTRRTPDPELASFVRSMPAAAYRPASATGGPRPFADFFGAGGSRLSLPQPVASTASNSPHYVSLTYAKKAESQRKRNYRKAAVSSPQETPSHRRAQSLFVQKAIVQSGPRKQPIQDYRAELIKDFEESDDEALNAILWAKGM